MEITEKKKKHNGGYYLKEKIAKLEAENAELQKDLDFALEKHKQERNELKLAFHKAADDLKEAKTTIDQQSRKISQLTADLHNSETLRLNADAAHSKKEGEMLRAMGPIRRWWWNLHHLPTFKEDERWNETH